MATDANAIRAGAAYVRLFVEDQISKRLDAVGRRLQAWGAQVARVGARIFAAGAAGTTAMLGMVAAFALTGAEMARVAQRTGITVEALSELRYAAEQNGVSFEQLQDGLKGMTQFLGQVRGRSAEAMLALSQLGVTAEELNGLSPDQAMERLGRAVDGIPDPTRRAALAMRIFGEAGGRLLPLFANGADVLRRAREEARALGIVMSTEDAQAAVGLTQAWNRLISLFNAAKDAIGAALAPAISQVLETITGLVRGVVGWIQRNRELARTILIAVVVVTAIGAALVALGVTLGIVGAAFTTLATIVTTAIGAIVGVVTFLLSPIGLVVAAVAGLTAAWLAWTDSGQRALRGLAGEFSAWSDVVKQALGAIWNAIRGGDLAAAGRIILATLRLAWVRVTNYLRETWSSWRDWALDIWDGLTDRIARGMIKAWGVVRRVWYTGLLGLLDAYESLAAFMPGGERINQVLAGGARIALQAGQAEVDPNTEAMLDQIEQEAERRRNRRQGDRLRQRGDGKRAQREALDNLAAAIAAGNAAAPAQGKQRPGAQAAAAGIDTNPILQASAPIGTFSSFAAAGMFGRDQMQRRMVNGIDQVAVNTGVIAADLRAALRFS